MSARGHARRGSLAIVAATVCLALPAGAQALTFNYGFDGGSSQGWNISGDGTRPGMAALTNAGPDDGLPPPGLWFQDFQAEPAFYAHFLAPAVPAGSYAANYGGALSLDFRVDDVPAVPFSILVDVHGDGSSMQGVSPPLALTENWQNVTVPIAAGSWHECVPGCVASGPLLSEAQIRQSLAGARFLDIDVDFILVPNEIYRVDNIRLTEPPPAPPATTPAPPSVPAKKKKKKCKKKGKGKKRSSAAKKKKRCKKKKKK